MPVRNWVQRVKADYSLPTEKKSGQAYDTYSYWQGYSDAIGDLEEYLSSERYEDERKKATLKEVRDALFGHGYHG